MLKKGLVIYEPRGRAGEYHPLAINLYRGCGHGCIYCYAPDVLYIDRPEFLKATPRKDIIKKMQRDIPMAAAGGATGNVLLCFTCDPYQPIDEVHQLTRQAIKILHDNGFNVTILTKGGLRAERDFDLYQPGDEFATTLTFTDAKQSLEWEPSAALPDERIEVLNIAHAKGIRTWVSLEPVIDPEQTLQLIRITRKFVDLFKVGKLNYHPREKKIDWRQFAKDAIATLEQYNCQYYMKKDLRGYLS